MKKSIVLTVIFFTVMVAVVLVAPRAAAGADVVAVAGLPHTAEEILLRRQSAEKLQERCGEIPPEYAGKAALIERARTFARGLGVWSDDMYKCYDPAPETSSQIYILTWVRRGVLLGDRGRIGWLSADYDSVLGLYVNVWGKDFGEWNTFSLPDMSEEEMAEFRSRLVEEGNAWYGRWTSTGTKKTLQEDILRLPVNKIVEDFFHEGCHDFFSSRGMTEIRNRAELEEPLCTVYGFRAGMMFLAAEGETTERQTLGERYRLSLERATWLDRLWWRLAVAFDAARSDEERIGLQEEILATVSEEDRFKYIGIEALNTAILSSIRTYTFLLLAMEELWRIITGEPPMDPPEDSADHVASATPSNDAVGISPAASFFCLQCNRDIKTSLAPARAPLPNPTQKIPFQQIQTSPQ